MFFKNIIGQKNLLNQLEKTRSKSQFPHSQVFVDQHGCGGLPIALSCALSLLYAEEEASLALDKGRGLTSFYENPDITYLFPLHDSKSKVCDYLDDWFVFLKENPYGSLQHWLTHIGETAKQGNISVGSINALNSSLNLKSFAGGKKICIIWGAEKLKKEASNKLLKILEEPPALTYFFIITDNVEDLLPTLKSRCQIINIPPAKNKDIKTYYSKTGLQENKIEYLTNAAMGSVRKAITLAKNESSSFMHEEMLIKCLRCAYSAIGNKEIVVDLMSWANELGGWSRISQKDFLDFTSLFVRESLLISYGSKTLAKYSCSTGFKIEKFAPFIHSENVEEMFELIENTIVGVQRNANGRILFSDFSLKIIRLLSIKEKV